MKTRIASAVCAVILTTQLPLGAHADGLAFAQAGMRHCGGDISRLCANVFPGGGRIAQCLIDKYGRLSPSCRSFVAKTKSAKGVLFACEADAARVCADVPPGKGRVVFCLNNNRAKLSPSCNRALDTAEAALTRQSALPIARLPPASHITNGVPAMVEPLQNALPLSPGAGAFLPIALAFIALEFGFARLAADHDDTYDGPETLASLGVAIGNIAMKILTGGLVAVPFMFVYQHRLLDIPVDRWWSLALLFLSVEFFYYWFHRASHRIRWFWATHAVHHSATRFNLSAAIRLGWTGQLSGAFLFFLPLAWLGFHPVAIVATLGLGLIYQFFLHTNLDVSLGPLEYVLNTPRHHRVHHASNEACLDRNYGSVLIIFDRLFGTYAAAPDEELQYGLKGREPSNNPLRIALGEWGYLLHDVRNAKGLANKFKVLWSPPRGSS